MPLHRIAFHFVDELPTDRALWANWLEHLGEPLRSLAELGERRPFIQIAAPFARRDQPTTTRDAEAAGLDAARALVNALGALATSTGRSIGLLFAAQPLGIIAPAGAEVAIEDKLAEWQALVAARPPDVPDWERKGFVSIWAGVLPRADFERLLDENYGDDSKPMSRFARELGIAFYDHDCLESSHSDALRSLRDVVAKLSFAASFIDLLPDDARERQVNSVILLFDADFAGQAKPVAGKRLTFVGAFPFSPATTTSS